MAWYNYKLVFQPIPIADLAVYLLRINSSMQQWINSVVSRCAACWQRSQYAIFLRNFQKYSVKILYAIIDWVCPGIPE